MSCIDTLPLFPTIEGIEEMNEQYDTEELATVINSALESYQEKLIERKEFIEEQDIEPSLNLTISELKRLTGRQRGRKAFIETFIQFLRDFDLRVELEDEVLKITKPVPVMKTDFIRLSTLIEAVEESGGVWWD